MAEMNDTGLFVRALGVYFGDASEPGYDPVAGLDGSRRVREAFPEQGEELCARIDGMFKAAFAQRGAAARGLEGACGAIRKYIDSGYPFLPPVLRAKIVNCCAYSLWK